MIDSHRIVRCYLTNAVEEVIKIINKMRFSTDFKDKEEKLMKDT
jgi:hypothetical protein